MKTLIFILFSFCGIAQSNIGISNSGMQISGSNNILLEHHGTNLVITADTSICRERGHVMSGSGSTTLLYCPSYIVDHENYSEIVHPACNSTTSYCMRCNKSFTEPGKEYREIIWKKK